MPSWSAVAYADAPAAPHGRPRRAATAHRRDPLRNGVLWIVVVGTLLAGLVALNVAVLQLNVRLDELGRERASLRDQNAALESRSSTAKVTALVQARARERLGLVPVPSSDMTYVELGRR
jgi:hypothetical protein